MVDRARLLYLVDDQRIALVEKQNADVFLCIEIRIRFKALCGDVP